MAGVPLVPIHTITVKRCGAKSKRTGQPCQQPAMRGKQRCRLHGGKSTGAKTPEGQQRAAMANYKHGEYSQKSQAIQALMNRILKNNLE